MPEVTKGIRRLPGRPRKNAPVKIRLAPNEQKTVQLFLIGRLEQHNNAVKALEPGLLADTENWIANSLEHHYKTVAVLNWLLATVAHPIGEMQPE